MAAARMMPAAIPTIPSATHRTTPGTAAAAVAASGVAPLAGRNPSKGRQVSHAAPPLDPLRSPLAKFDPTIGSDEGVGLRIDFRANPLRRCNGSVGPVKDTVR